MSRMGVILVREMVKVRIRPQEKAVHLLLDASFHRDMFELGASPPRNREAQKH